MIPNSSPASRIALVTGLCLTLGILTSFAEQTAGRVKTIQIPGGLKVMKAQIGVDGTIHVLLDAEDGPRYVKSSDAGISFGAPMKIVSPYGAMFSQHWQAMAGTK